VRLLSSSPDQRAQFVNDVAWGDKHVSLLNLYESENTVSCNNNRQSSWLPTHIGTDLIVLAVVVRHRTVPRGTRIQLTLSCVIQGVQWLTIIVTGAAAESYTAECAPDCIRHFRWNSNLQLRQRYHLRRIVDCAWRQSAIRKQRFEILRVNDEGRFDDTPHEQKNNRDDSSRHDVSVQLYTTTHEGEMNSTRWACQVVNWTTIQLQLQYNII